MADRRRRRGRREGRTLDIIYGHYKEALEALPLERIPGLAPHLLDAGVCFGFADPVTNIITNTVHLVPDEDVEPDPSCARKRKRSTIPVEDGEPDLSCAKKRKRMTTTEAISGATVREEVLSQIAAGDVPSSPEARTIAERSLKGFLIFLTTYFRHLPTREALRYLYLAGADLLVAVRLIELDRHLRRKDRFSADSHATKVAINCAALSAGLLKLDSFLGGIYGLVSHLKRITQSVAADRRCLSVQDVHCLSELLKKPLEYGKSDNPMGIASQRIPHQENASIGKVPVELTESLRGVLLDRMHDFYLMAVSRLPMKEIRTHYHRGLLKAGYCYGPFNPVYNIIVNTMWYSATFPATEEFEVDMIYTMRHVESRSLSGLIAFLRASIPEVSEHEAMIYLLKSDLRVVRAVQMVNEDWHTSGSADKTGYKAAADASSHPKCEEFLEFVVQILPAVSSAVKSVMKASHVISSRDVTCLSKLLATGLDLLEPPLELKLTEDAVDMLSRYKKDFLTEQSVVRAKVQAALQKYEQAKGCCYELGVICVVNNNVGKKINIRNSKKECSHVNLYSHVNFWATRKNEEKPTLFFAQFSNDEDKANIHSICYPVTGLSTHDVRCCYCEFKVVRIVHPAEVYWDGGIDFEKISCGEHKITIEKIISRGRLIDSDVDGFFDQHYIYLDPIWDCKSISSINRIAWRATLSWEEQLQDAADKNYNKLNEDHDT